MKKLLFLMLIPVFVWGQVIVDVPNQGLGEDADFLRVISTKTGSAVDTAEIFGRTFTSVTSDTTQILPVFRGKTLWLQLAALDSCSILPKYQLSLDGSNWAPSVSLDSLKMTSQTYVIKSINMSTVADSARFVRFILDFSTNAYAKGTTTPTYSAAYAYKRD